VQPHSAARLTRNDGRGYRDRVVMVRLSALAAAVAATLVAGAWVASGVVAPRLAAVAGHGAVVLAIGLGVAWFVVAGRSVRRLAGGDAVRRRVLQATCLVTAVAVGAVAVYTSVRTTTVDEAVATGVPTSRLPALADVPAGAVTTRVAPAPENVELAAGRFDSLDESASGRAAVVRLVSGARVLTLTAFSSSNGPDVRVYLVAGAVRRGSDVRDIRDLGALKGNRGNQQYSIPDGVDIQRYATVVIYCRTFAVAFGAAALQPS
jgi:Electron transfer DM13